MKELEEQRTVPRSKHSLTVIQTNQLMLYREIIAVFCQFLTKHINALCGQNGEFLDFNLVVHIVTTDFYKEVMMLLWTNKMKYS
jgi:hypothetical protein